MNTTSKKFKVLGQRLQDQYWPLQIQILGKTEKRMLVHQDVTMRVLHQQIVDRLEDLVPDIGHKDEQTYHLYAGKRLLTPSISVHQLRKQDVRRLRFAASNQDLASLTMRHILVLQPDNRDAVEIRTLPVTIGRKKPSAAQEDYPDIDLSHLDNSNTISGQHAQLSRQQNVYYIENLTEHNRIFIHTKEGEERQVVYGTPSALEVGSTIRLGKAKVKFLVKPIDVSNIGDE
jgi:hypothetical protein